MSTKREFPIKLGQPMLQPSAKPTIQTILNDATALVSKGGNAQTSGPSMPEVIETPSDSGSSEEYDDDDEDDDEDDDDEHVANADKDVDAGGPNGQDVDMADVMDAPDVADAEGRSPVPEDADERGEPSFGDLVMAHTSEVIDVADTYRDFASTAPAYAHNAQLQSPSGTSLGTVLTQALKTDDLELLESCLQNLDVATIRATVQRLESPLAATLLQKLADRLHRRPGRAGTLMVWIQWTLVAHGGYLAAQPALVKKLAALNRVIDERARGLQSLLSLKGKLDMLEAQLHLRRMMKQQQHQDDADDEEGVIYVEGQEKHYGSSKKARQRSTSNGPRGFQSRRDQANGISANQSDISETMPLGSNGTIVDSVADDEDEEDEDDDYGSSEDDKLVDDEAEETDNDSAEARDEDEVDHSDVDDMDEEDDSDYGASPPRNGRDDWCGCVSMTGSQGQ